MKLSGITAEECIKIRKLLYRDPHYTFMGIPKRIPKINGVIHVEKLRNDLLRGRLQGETDFVKTYKNLRNTYDTEKKNLNAIEQYPIPITNKDQWTKICTKEGCTPSMKDNNGTKYWNRNLFYLDLFLPVPRVAFEIDYDSSHPCPEYDSARDSYLYEKYRIITIRYKDWGKDSGTTNKLRANLMRIMDEVDGKEYKPKALDFTSFSILEFRDVHRIELDVLELIREKFGYDKKEIEVTEKELGRFYTATKHKKIPQSIERLEKIMKMLDIEFKITGAK